MTEYLTNIIININTIIINGFVFVFLPSSTVAGINAACVNPSDWPTNWCNYMSFDPVAQAAKFVGMAALNGACWQDAAESAKQLPVRGVSGSCFSDVDCAGKDGLAGGSCIDPQPMTSAKALESIWLLVEPKALVLRFKNGSTMNKRRCVFLKLFFFHDRV